MHEIRKYVVRSDCNRKLQMKKKILTCVNSIDEREIHDFVMETKMTLDTTCGAYCNNYCVSVYIYIYTYVTSLIASIRIKGGKSGDDADLSRNRILRQRTLFSGEEISSRSFRTGLIRLYTLYDEIFTLEAN